MLRPFIQLFSKVIAMVLVARMSIVRKRFHTVLWISLATLMGCVGVCPRDVSPFLVSVNHFWLGDYRQRPLTAISDRNLEEFLSVEFAQACPLAASVAHMLVAEQIVWLSRYFANEIIDIAARDKYDLEAWDYATQFAEKAMDILNRETDALTFVPLLGQGDFVVLAESLSSTVPKFEVVLGLGRNRKYSSSFVPHEEGLDASVAASKEHGNFIVRGFPADGFWGEVWLPALPAPWFGLDAGPFGLPTGGSYDGFHSDFRHHRELPLTALVPNVEAAMKALFQEALTLLNTLVQYEVVKAFWPRSSTLIALLRHGKLMGTFHDGQFDCVDQDIDLSVELVDSTKWPTLVRAVAGALKHGPHKCDCYLGAVAEDLVQPAGRFQQLMCMCKVEAFILPVSFERVFERDPSPDLGICSAYDLPVPCPLNIEHYLAKYAGCVATPTRSETDSFTIVKNCTSWMTDSLSKVHLLELRSKSRLLAAQGFLSMEKLWASSACAEIDSDQNG